MMNQQEMGVARQAARRHLGPETELAGLAQFTVFAADTVEMPDERRSAFRAHLHQQYAAMTPDAPAPSTTDRGPTTPIDVGLGKICALCRGRCCGNGGNWAYITSATLAATTPQATPHDIVERYMAHVPSHSHAGSCLFHTESGCALPRDLRSETCNRHLCPDLGRIAVSSIDEPGRPHIAAFVGPDGKRQTYVVRFMEMHPVDPGA